MIKWVGGSYQDYQNSYVVKFKHNYNHSTFIFREHEGRHKSGSTETVSIDT